MKYSKSFLVKQSKQIEKQIWDHYIDKNGLSEPIVDGIVNIDQYLNSKFKILWILKEPHDDIKENKPSGGGWHFCKDFLNMDDIYYRTCKSHATWHPIIYTSYGILNDFLLYSQMSKIRNNKSMTEIVKKIAVINVNKLPGFTRTYDYSNIWHAYNDHKDILLRQIKTYNPDIVIGGSTLQLFFDDLGIRTTLKTSNSIDFSVNNSKLYISAYHPAQTKITRDIYINDITSVALIIL
jgi:hypothetical protein